MLFSYSFLFDCICVFNFCTSWCNVLFSNANLFLSFIKISNNSFNLLVYVSFLFIFVNENLSKIGFVISVFVISVFIFSINLFNSSNLVESNDLHNFNSFNNALCLL